MKVFPFALDSLLRLNHTVSAQGKDLLRSYKFANYELIREETPPPRLTRHTIQILLSGGRLLLGCIQGCLASMRLFVVFQGR